MGPRTPIMSPGFILCRWVVTFPTLLTVNLIKPRSVGDVAIPMGISPRPATERIANWPGIYANFFSCFRIEEHQLECLQIAIFGFRYDGIDSDRIGQIRVVHFCSSIGETASGRARTARRGHPAADLPYVDIDRTGLHAPAAAYAGRAVVVLVLIIFELVHEALAHPLCFLAAGIVAGTVKREKRKHAGIPQPQPFAFIRAYFVLDVETPAGGTQKRTGAAVNAGELDLLPDRRVEELEHIFLRNGGRIEGTSRCSARQLFFLVESRLKRRW